MKVLFTDVENETDLVVGLEPSNKISVIINNNIHELDYQESINLLTQLSRYVHEQEHNIKKQLPWWRRFL